MQQTEEVVREQRSRGRRAGSEHKCQSAGTGADGRGSRRAFVELSKYPESKSRAKSASNRVELNFGWLTITCAIGSHPTPGEGYIVRLQELDYPLLFGGRYNTILFKPETNHVFCNNTASQPACDLVPRGSGDQGRRSFDRYNLHHCRDEQATSGDDARHHEDLRSRSVLPYIRVQFYFLDDGGACHGAGRVDPFDEKIRTRGEDEGKSKLISFSGVSRLTAWHQMGSKRFGAFIVYASVISTLSELVIFNIFFDTERYSGPYPQLGAVLALYHRYTPRLHPKFFGILGYDLSEKSLTYGLCAQVVMSGGFSTFIPSLVGFVSGLLCVSLSENLLPNFVHACCNSIGSSFADEAPAIMMARTVQRGGTGNRQRRAAQRPTAAVAPPVVRRPPPPPEEAIAQLCSMGFERAAVIRALQQSDNNVEAAANRLLMG
ncbi:hypothetical protein THAOC_02596 [Thalassiosira oceanica]|uniref:UBA domain-containing protein n=1 Tax=Thalassiosira oceanica TaxID=159749 RepID=K0TLW3_THAOC|nr:hypothetical protein THAOC_02596 [Thalassiosira oceanica]|eukprot:EJK75676.1 hypothetical protein THAOC_02596 [Thalassiosira oceanica]